jgi:hypothetical protein
LDVRVVQRGTENISADSSKTINPYFNCHFASARDDEDTNKKRFTGNRKW